MLCLYCFYEVKWAILMEQSNSHVLDVAPSRGVSTYFSQMEKLFFEDSF